MASRPTQRTPTFARFEIIDELGSGGMGNVYKPRHRFTRKVVAFKMLPPALRTDGEVLECFRREAEALGR